MIDKKNLILASASPRRKELLDHLWHHYQVIPSFAPEIIDPKKTPTEIVTDLALLKATDVYKKLDNSLNFVIGADTIVVYEDQILGKPKDIIEAEETLSLLSGKKHYVYTGVSFVWADQNQMKTHHFFEKTQVEFEQISPKMLKSYLYTRDSLDKAGSYGIQGKSLSFIKEINGSYSNVVGFPINKVMLEIERILNKDFFDIFN